jgi:hypothetical protein
LNGSFNSSTERLVGGKLLKQFSYQVSVCLLFIKSQQNPNIRTLSDPDVARQLLPDGHVVYCDGGFAESTSGFMKPLVPRATVPSG